MDAKAIDTKMEDGDGSRGKVRGTQGGSKDGDCMTPVETSNTGSEGDADYNIGNDGVACRLFYYLVF